MKKIIFAALALVFTITSAASALEIGGEELDLLKWLSGIKVGGKYYLAYTTGHDNKVGNYNRFSINRSYFTFKKKVNDNLSSRITMDAHQTASGMNVRLKYIYAHFKFDDMGFIANPNIEFGQVHTAWLDFEQNLNYYRMQGSMFVDRVGIASSADLGFTVGGYFGGEMDKEYKKKVNKKYAGRYGSFAFGLYNGGGYSAAENNQGKVVQTRLSIRPVPDVIPGLQASYYGIFGDGNTAGATDDLPDWNTNLVMLSYESQHLTATGQYLMGGGNKKGSSSWYDPVTGDPYDLSGYSVFAEGKLDENWRVIGRYDFFDPNTDGDDDEHNRMIMGAGYDFGKRNILILDYETVTYEDAAKDDENAIKLTMQVSF